MSQFKNDDDANAEMNIQTKSNILIILLVVRLYRYTYCHDGRQRLLYQLLFRPVFWGFV